MARPRKYVDQHGQTTSLETGIGRVGDGRFYTLDEASKRTYFKTFEDAKVHLGTPRADGRRTLGNVVVMHPPGDPATFMEWAAAVLNALGFGGVTDNRPANGNH